MSRVLWGLIACILVLCAAGASPGRAQDAADAKLGRETGLPIPRFVSIRAQPAHIRNGPGTQFPVKWVFAKAGVPLQITEEIGDWRRMVDYEGETGWIHKSLLAEKRTVIVTERRHPIRRRPEIGATIIAFVDPMVVGELRRCEPDWCQIDVGRYRGWMERQHFFGVLPNEELQ